MLEVVRFGLSQKKIPSGAKGRERKKDFDKQEGNFLSEWYRCGADTKKPPMGST